MLLLAVWGAGLMLLTLYLITEDPPDPPDGGGPRRRPPYDMGPTVSSTLRPVGNHGELPTSSTRSLHREEVPA